LCSTIAQTPGCEAAFPHDGESQSETAALSRAYSTYALGVGSSISDVQAVSHHIRRRRCNALARSLLNFAGKVVVVASGIVLGVLCQQPALSDTEAIRLPQELNAPGDTGVRIRSDQSDPVIDEMPSTVV
jgi:hypothetical protein